MAHELHCSDTDTKRQEAGYLDIFTVQLRTAKIHVPGMQLDSVASGREPHRQLVRWSKERQRRRQEHDSLRDNTVGT